MYLVVTLGFAKSKIYIVGRLQNKGALMSELRDIDLEIEKIEREEERLYSDPLTLESPSPYFYRPHMSTLNHVKADAESIKRFMNCAWDEVVVLNQRTIAPKIMERFDNISSKGFDRAFEVI